MQIPYVKYLKTKNQDTLLVYFERNALFFKIGTNSGWSHAQMIADEVNPSFALSYYNGEAFLLYSTRLGELYIVRTSDFVKWDRKQISIEKKDLSQTKFFMTTDQSALHLFYHLPTETAGVHALIYTVFRNGKWEKPCQIDRFLPFGQTPFLTGKRNPRHIMLYYRSARNVVTVREMLLSPSTIGSMYPVIQTPYPCTDLSIIQDEERIHMLYIVKNFFRSQVIYQYKQATSISAPRVLWEGGSCEQCLIFQRNHKLEAMWIAGGQPYCCQSVDNGNRFSPIERYTAFFPYHCIKGELLTEDKTVLNASEAFGDGQNGFQLAVFAPAAPVILLENDIMAASRESDAYFATKQQSKNQQIEELTKLLVRRGEELANLNMRWRERQNQIETEKQNLMAQVSALETENIRLQEKIALLEAENKRLEEKVPSQNQNEKKEEQEMTAQQEVSAISQEEAVQGIGEEENTDISLLEQKEDSLFP